MKAWNRSIAMLNTVTKYVATIGFILLFVCVMMQVVWRYLLEIPLPWSDEAARYLLIWVSLLSIAIAFRNDSHIRLDHFINLLGAPIRHAVWVLFNLLTVVFLSLLIVYGVPNAVLGKFTCSPGISTCFAHTSVTMFVPYLSVPVAAAIMLLNLVDYIIHNFKTQELGDVREGDAS